MPELLISDLAELSGVPASTLRYYEQQGLLPAARTPAGYRVYDQGSVERLRFISAAKHLQLSLDSIRDLLGAWAAEPCRTVKAQLRPMLQSRLGQVDVGMAELRALEQSLRMALRRLDELPDRGEHCDPECGFLTDGPTREPVPAPVPVAIACSLEGSARSERVAQWQSVLAGALIEEVAGGVVATVQVAAAGVLARLVVAEQKCCPFLRFEIAFTPMNLRLSITADKHARAFIDELVRVDRAQRS